LISNWVIQQFVDDTTIAHLTLALLLGTVIGMERQWRQRTAGLRTNALVALGAASFVDLAHSVATTSAGVTQVIAYIVSGVGFLGAGAIMKEGTNVRGLNTAATVWCSAAVGAAAAADQVQVAVVTTVGVVFLNVMIRAILGRFDANAAGPPPPLPPAVTSYFVVRIVCPREHVAHIRGLLLQALQQTRLTPTALTNSNEREASQITAQVTGDAPDVERVVARLVDEPTISSIGWQDGASMRTEDKSSTLVA
jgi:putative Mg2+ transporter-C (MgtC) family protein